MSAPEPEGGPATYVYGVTRTDATAPDVAGVGGEPVRLVPHGSLAALVSDVDREDVRAATRSLRAHARVLDAAVQAGPVVPLRFGTLVDGEDAVVGQVLQEYGDQLDALLERLGPHVELAVKATYDEDTIVRQLVAAEPALAAQHERLAGIDPDAAYYERIRLGEQVAAALEQRRDGDAEEIYAALGELADAVSPGEPLDPHMVLNGTFLVRRTDVGAFDDRIGTVARAHPEIQLRYVGPLAPYSFSDLGPVG